MAVNDGVETIITTLVEELAKLQRGRGYTHSPRVARERVDLASLTASDAEGLFVETAVDVPETRTQRGDNQISYHSECTCGIELWASLLDPEDSSVKLNRLIRDILRRIYSREWDFPTWAGGRGKVTDITFPAIERHIERGTTLKASRIVMEFHYYDDNYFPEE